MKALLAEDVIEILGLSPLPQEGGYYAETYRAPEAVPAAALPQSFGGPRSLGSAIYYLLTPETCSALHRLKGDEIYHFYFGDPVEMVNLHPGGDGDSVILGPDLAAGQRLQHTVPRGTWQGARLAPGGRFALMGTTVSPGFEFGDREMGDSESLSAAYPAFSEQIGFLSPPPE